MMNMRAVKAAIDQAEAERMRDLEAESEREEMRRNHSGPEADQRIDYVKDLVNKSED